MKKVVKASLYIVAILVAAGALLGLRMSYAVQAPPKIRVVNDSDTALENFLLEGSGFRERLGSVPPHDSRKVIVHPMGESGLKVTFQVGSQRYQEEDLAYIESSGGYYVTVRISQHYEVKAQSSFLRMLIR